MPDRAPDATIVSPSGALFVTDLAPARIGFLQSIDMLHHALATAWGGAGMWIDLRLGEGESCEVRIQVPPSVVNCDLEFVVSGIGKVTADTTNESGVTAAGWTALGSDDLTNAIKIAPANAIKVRASAAWGWASETITIASVAVGSEDSTIWGVLVRPVFVATAI